MHGALPRRPGNAIGRQLEPGAVRLAIGLRGNHGSAGAARALVSDDCFHLGDGDEPAMPMATDQSRRSELAGREYRDRCRPEKGSAGWMIDRRA